MKKLIPAAFIVVAAVLAFFIFARNLFVKDDSVSRAKIVVPVINEKENDKKEGNEYDDDLAQSSFIQLANGETLLGTSEFDVDADGFDDQVNIIKTASSPFITLIVGLYDNENGVYTRTYYITTNISQVKTFVCTGLDVLGKHKKSLVYQGVTDDGKISLIILHGKNHGSHFEMDILGSFEADGTIFIQQSQRSESYELSHAPGEAFPVWVYTSDSVENARDSARLDQIQTMYVWNEDEYKYVADRTIRVAGNRVAAKELAKIQDGNVATFARFLDGLWYKTENEGKGIRHIFFDYENSEIIFEFGDSEEVYSWLNSNLRRNGIYFSSVNKSIENLQRRFDISLVNIDEIRIKLQDDVRMLISESNLWDGNYKKFSGEMAAKSKKSAESDCLERLVKQSDWISSDETVYKFSDSSFLIKKGKLNVGGGRFTFLNISGTTLVQFKSGDTGNVLSGTYLPSFMESTIAEKDKRGVLKNRKVTDRDTIVLQKVIISPDSFYKDQSVPVVVKKYTPPKEEDSMKAPETLTVAKSEEKYTGAPKLKVGIYPQYFSPDGDGQFDTLSITLGALCAAPIKSWSFVITDPNTKSVFWSVSGTSTLTENIIWNGKSKNSELVQSATDYPYVFTVEDEKGLSNTVKGFVQVDILVIRDGDRMKLQVPSIMFRSDAADFKSDAEVRADPKWDGVSKGLDPKTLENNLRVMSRVSEILKKFRDYDVTIEGNANNLSGTQKEEDEIRILSERRAQFVRDWLIKDGVSASHLTAVGNGSKNPVTLSKRIEDKWKNRRVEFILKK